MKKGFTLIELLAVILILAIIALIAIPVVNTILNDSKKASSKESANNYVKAVEQTMALKIVKSEVVAGNYTVDALASSIQIKGTKPSKGTLVIDNNGNVTSATLCINNTKINYTDDRASIATTGSCADIADPVPACAYTSGKTWTFDYTGAVQNFTVPCTGDYKLEVWGASGGGTGGGKGGYSVGTVGLAKDIALYVYTGGTGSVISSDVSSGGFNGGGGNYSDSGTTGGGASDIRITTDSLYARVLVAGGGGGGGWSGSTPSGAQAGGTGGGLTGANGTANSGWSTWAYGIGGTQIAGGGSVGTSTGGGGQKAAVTNGAFGAGGKGSGSGSGGAGGGGGWYGGGPGMINAAGGGSGWIYTESAFTAWQTGNAVDAANWTLASKYYLTSAAITSGNASMPSHDGATTMTGNSGNGYAKITYIG